MNVLTHTEVFLGPRAKSEIEALLWGGLESEVTLQQLLLSCGAGTNSSLWVLQPVIGGHRATQVWHSCPSIMMGGQPGQTWGVSLLLGMQDRSMTGAAGPNFSGTVTPCQVGRPLTPLPQVWGPSQTGPWANCPVWFPLWAEHPPPPDPQTHTHTGKFSEGSSQAVWTNLFIHTNRHPWANHFVSLGAQLCGQIQVLHMQFRGLLFENLSPQNVSFTQGGFCSGT